MSPTPRRLLAAAALLLAPHPATAEGQLTGE